jgi:hypothetical protein
MGVLSTGVIDHSMPMEKSAKGSELRLIPGLINFPNLSTFPAPF